MPDKLDVVIVGGGVIGCATAYYLSRRKLRVQIIERDAIGSQASGVAAGVLSPLLSAEKPGAFLDIAMAAVKLHRDLGAELKEESGLDAHYGEVSILCPAFTAAEEKGLQEEYAWQRTTGLDVNWLGPSQVAALNVGMTSEVRAAVCYPRHLQVESYRLVLAYAQAAERHGASIRQGQVVGFSHSGSRVSGVLLADGQKVPADAVLLTTGPWTTEAGSWLGCRLPVVPERGQILRLDVADINKSYAPFYGETYVLPKVDGSVLAGTTREHGVYENRVTEDGRASIVRRVSAMMPGLAGGTPRPRGVGAAAHVRRPPAHAGPPAGVGQRLRGRRALPLGHAAQRAQRALHGPAHDRHPNRISPGDLRPGPLRFSLRKGAGDGSNRRC